MIKTLSKDGKWIEKKPISKEKTMSQILIEQNHKMDELGHIPDDPDLPPNWYKNSDLLYQEELKRWDSLNKENLSIDEIKARLIKAEILIEYELFTEHRLLQLYVEGRITIKKAIERDIKTRENKTAGRRKQTEPNKIKAKKIFDEITGESVKERRRLFLVRTKNVGINDRTARDYWKEFMTQ